MALTSKKYSLKENNINLSSPSSNLKALIAPTTTTASQKSVNSSFKEFSHSPRRKRLK